MHKDKNKQVYKTRYEHLNNITKDVAVTNQDMHEILKCKSARESLRFIVAQKPKYLQSLFEARGSSPSSL